MIELVRGLIVLVVSAAGYTAVLLLVPKEPAREIVLIVFAMLLGIGLSYGLPK